MTSPTISELFRTRYAGVAWIIPMRSQDVEHTLSIQSAAPVLVPSDGPHGRAFYVFSSREKMTAWTKHQAKADHNFLESAGGHVFWSAWQQKALLFIDAGTPEEKRLSAAELESAVAVLQAIRVEDALRVLRFEPSRFHTAISIVRSYENYLIGYAQTSRGTAVSLAPDHQNRDLVAVFTSVEAFQAYVSGTRQNDMKARKLDGEQCWMALSRIPAFGFVFNCFGPTKPIAFTAQMAQIVLTDQKSSA